MVLILDIFVLIPISKQLNTNFLEYKKAKQNLTLKPMSLDKNFLIGLYTLSTVMKINSIVALRSIKHQQQKDEKLIVATNAVIDNEKGTLRLNLDQERFLNLQKKIFNKLILSECIA